MRQRSANAAKIGSTAQAMAPTSVSAATPARVAVFAAVGVLMIAGAFLYLKSRSAFEESRRDLDRDETFR